jgi:hypothetical protein
MLPLIMAALNLLQSNQKQKEQAKQDEIAADQGQAPAPKQMGGGQDMNGIMNMLKTFKTQSPALQSNGLSKGTNSMLDSEGFDGKGEPDNDDLLS